MPQRTYNYALRKFRDAVRTLVGHRSIDERLASAFTDIKWLKPENLPPEIRKKFEQFRRNMRKKGSAHESVKAMSETQLKAMTAAVVEMFENLASRPKTINMPAKSPRPQTPRNGRNGREEGQ